LVHKSVPSTKRGAVKLSAQHFVSQPWRWSAGAVPMWPTRSEATTAAMIGWLNKEYCKGRSTWLHHQ